LGGRLASFLYPPPPVVTAALPPRLHLCAPRRPLGEQYARADSHHSCYKTSTGERQMMKFRGCPRLMYATKSQRLEYGKTKRQETSKRTAPEDGRDGRPVTTTQPAGARRRASIARP